MDITLTSILTHISQQLPDVWKILESGTFLAGIYFAFKSVLLMKEYSDANRGQAKLGKPISALLLAAALLYWPTLMHLSMETLFNSATPLPYQYPAGKSANYHVFMQTIGAILQIFGFYAFIRGWVMLAQIAQQGAKEGAFSKALIHIVAGIMAINIFGTWELIKSIIGI